MSRPDDELQLQLNNSGAWKTVARFHASEKACTELARAAVKGVALVDARAAGNWRIVRSDARELVVLEYFEPSRGWRVRA